MDDASLQGHILSHECGIFGFHKQAELAQRLAFNAREHECSMEDMRMRMAEAYMAYRRARKQLSFAYPSAYAFLVSDIALDQSLWPWLDAGRADAGLGMQRHPEIPQEVVEALRAKIFARKGST